VFYSFVFVVVFGLVFVCEIGYGAPTGSDKKGGSSSSMSSENGETMSENERKSMMESQQKKMESHQKKAEMHHENHEFVLDEMNTIMQSLNGTLADTLMKIKKKEMEWDKIKKEAHSSMDDKMKLQRQLEVAEKEKAALQKVHLETKHKMDEIMEAIVQERKSKEELMAKLYNMSSTSAEREALYRNEHDDKIRLSRKLIDLERHLVDAQKDLKDKTLRRDLVKVAVSIGNFLESPRTESFLKASFSRLFSESERLEEALESALQKEVELIVDKKHAGFVATALAWIFLLAPIVLLQQIFVRINRRLSVRMYVLALYIAQLLLCVTCAVFSVVWKADPVAVLSSASDYSVNSYVITLFLLLLMILAPIMFSLLFLSAITAASSLERLVYLLQIVAYFVMAKDVKHYVWDPLIHSRKSYVSIPAVIYASHAVSFACMTYLCLRSRSVADCDDLTRGVSAVVNSVEMRLPSSATTDFDTEKDD